MEGLLRPLYEIEEFSALISSLKKNTSPVMVTGIFESQKAHIASGILKELHRPSIFVTFNEMNAKRTYEDLKVLLGDKVYHYPAKELMLFNIEAEGLPITANRLKVIEKLLTQNNITIVASIEALQSKIPPLEIYKSHIKRFRVGERYNISELSKYFTSIGYQFSDIVEGRGQYSVRGGILDFFSVNGEKAYRIDFFDDEIDSIKTFDISSQRSISNHSEVVVFPAREIIFDKDTAEQAIKRIKKDLEHVKSSSKHVEHMRRLEEKVGHDIERIKSGIFFAGIEKYISYFYENASTLIDYLPSESMVFIDEYNKVEQTSKNYFEHVSETLKDYIEKGSVIPQCINSIYQFENIIKFMEKKRVVHLNTFLHNASELKPLKVFNIASKPIPSFNGKVELMIEDIKRWRNSKRIVIMAGSRARAERLVEILNSNDISCSLADINARVPKIKEIFIVEGSLYKGFEYSLINFIVISDKEILGEDKKKKRHKKKLGQKIKAFSELSTGDFVVHQVHGVGQYIGIEQLKVEGVVKDYFKIKYLQGDLYVPVSQLDLIQKYIGSEGKAPKLNRLGGADWNKIKSRVKESVQDLAKELIRLYAERETLRGFSFPKDTVWQRQFEETFPYEETDDQLQCIEEAKGDMEKPRPMDRLLCGDVGYGKTEVAMRAAFKAVMGGKQVAYLVPTTILAQQHYNSFVQRMRDFPVRTEMLSRFRSPKEQKSIIKELKDGSIDIIIGTHRLLQKDIVFKDVGLVIVDEEQRFGVTHKEKLKTLRKNVDVLTLTATPIPRTLHMALTGVRDMSVIEEPPEERYPVQTYVLEHDSEVVKDAIERELNRGGQVFFLHNKVSSIHKIASEIRNLVPEARVVYAHGQMSENELESIIMDFLEGEYDVLVCTTIIETGVDMPNVNTIIIEDADKMGLSQLYQLRGRVGRSNRQAYAYLTFRKNKVLSEEADKRLKAIKEFTEFGSGFKIAMRDLEIRGAGNLLGAEQHGHMNLVGYEMYCRILEDTISELRGEKVKETVETTIDINISAYIDDRYISNPTQKIMMYKKIAAIEDENDTLDIRSELLDRYGDIPKEVDNLIEIAYIKALGMRLGILSVAQKGSNIIITFAGNNVDLKIVGELVNKYKRRILFTASNNPYITFKTEGLPSDKLLENIKFLLQSINKLQQG